jgi:hypothetical protein
METPLSIANQRPALSSLSCATPDPRNRDVVTHNRTASSRDEEAEITP